MADTFAGQEREIDGFDTIVISYGAIENDGLYYDLKDTVKEIYAVGDCKGIRKIMWTTNEGATIARMI